MGTRSLTVFEGKEAEIVVMYRQYDGYPSGHGKELADFLWGMKLVNGFSLDGKKEANGMGCLAAQVVSFFKAEVGGFYLHPAGTRDCGEEYIYFISEGEGWEPYMRVIEPAYVSEAHPEWNKVEQELFSGYVSAFDAYLNEEIKE